MSRNRTLDLIRNYQPTASAAGEFPTARSSRVEGLDDRMSSLREARGFRVGHRTITINGWTVRQASEDLSEKQAKWVIDIALTKDGVTPAMIDSLKVRLEQGFAKSAASQFITKYKDLPRKATAQQAAKEQAEVPDGRYAIQLPSQDKPHFYLVKHGRKPGIIFVDHQVSDDRFPVRVPRQRLEILDEIAKNVEEAGLLYSTLLGVCRRCGRTLTDVNNPYFNQGLGPECGKK